MHPPRLVVDAVSFGLDPELRLQRTLLDAPTQPIIDGLALGLPNRPDHFDPTPRCRRHPELGRVPARPVNHFGKCSKPDRVGSPSVKLLEPAGTPEVP